jgi:hypothetical protein
MELYVLRFFIKKKEKKRKSKLVVWGSNEVRFLLGIVWLHRLYLLQDSKHRYGYGYGYGHSDTSNFENLGYNIGARMHKYTKFIYCDTCFLRNVVP